MSIERRRYLDGGPRSQTNADLAQGFYDVLVIAPVDRGAPEREVALLARSGRKITVIRPEAAPSALGRELAVLDPAGPADSVACGGAHRRSACSREGGRPS